MAIYCLNSKFIACTFLLLNLETNSYYSNSMKTHVNSFFSALPCISFRFYYRAEVNVLRHKSTFPTTARRRMLTSIYNVMTGDHIRTTTNHLNDHSLYIGRTSCSFTIKV